MAYLPVCGILSERRRAAGHGITAQLADLLRMTGTKSLEASSEGKEIRELRENSEETVSLGYRRRKKSNFIDS